MDGDVVVPAIVRGHRLSANADLLADCPELHRVDPDDAILQLRDQQHDRHRRFDDSWTAVRNSRSLRRVVDADFVAGDPDAVGADGTEHAVPAAVVCYVPAAPS